jgi:iron complex outermembrane receptor protein
MSCAALALAAAWTGAPAMAQAAEPPEPEAADTAAPDAADGEETVYVTAQRYTTALQRTPIAMSVLSGERLTESGINNTSDLALHTPGFVLTTNIVQGQAYIRGIGTDIASISADTSVAFMLDGVYLPRLSTSLQDFFDVDRVEVLKGPQGTLYGRNATGGVVNIVSELPSQTFGAKADILFGNYNQQRYRASVTGPLTDTVSARLTLIRRSRDGYVDNLLTGDDVDNVDNWAGRAMLLWQPNEDLDILLSGDISDDGGAPSSSVRIVSDTAPAILFGGTVLPDPYDVYLNFKPSVDNKQSGGSAKVTWRMGDLTFTSLTAARQSKFKLVLDLDGTEVNWFTHDPDIQHSDTFSQEFQLSGTSGNLEWVAGLFYFREEADSSYNLFLPLVGVNVRPEATNTTNAYAAFAQASYAVTDSVKLTAGARYSYEEKDASVDSFFNNALVGSFDGSDNWNAFTPKFGIEYYPDDDSMLYVSATRGFKSGGFNSTAIQDPQGFEPEYIWAYEAGYKGSLADGRVKLNLAAFYYDYTDLQVNKYTSGSLVTLENAASATVKGIEADISARVTDYWNIGGSIAWLDATYDDFDSVDPDAPAAGLADLSGNQLVRAPKLSFNLNTDVRIPLGESWDLVARTEYSYRSKIYFTPFNNPEVAQDGFGLWDASLTFEPREGDWHVRLFVKNITEEFYYQEMARSASIVGTIGWPGEPRTFGIEFGVDY